MSRQSKVAEVAEMLQDINAMYDREAAESKKHDLELLLCAEKIDELRKINERLDRIDESIMLYH